MSKLLFFFTSSIFCLSLSAQQSGISITKNQNGEIGNPIYKYQIKYKNPGIAGKSLKWNFSALDVLDNHYSIKYFHPDNNDSTLICGLEHNTRYYYRIRNDSLWTTGLENHTTILNYTKPELLMKYPFRYGDTLSSRWEGEGIYGNLFSLRVKGKTTVRADAEGKLVLPDKNEMDSVLRVHITKQYEETGKDKLRMTVDAYKWYSPNHRHPVFESIKTILHKSDKDTTIFSTSFYYLPQKNTVTEVKKETKDSVKNNKNSSEINKILSQVRTFPNPVKNDLTVEYKLTRRAQVQFALYNMSGTPVLRTNRKLLEGGFYTEIIPMNHLMTDAYVIHLLVDDLVLSRVIIKH